MAKETEKDRIISRLQQIKEQASEMNAQQVTKAGITGSDLAEEAASLGLQLLQGDDD